MECMELSRVGGNKGLNNHAVALMHSRLDKCTNRYAIAHQKSPILVHADFDLKQQMPKSSIAILILKYLRTLKLIKYCQKN